MLKFSHKAIFLIALLMLGHTTLCAQNINVEDLINIKEKKVFKFGGSVSVAGTYYDANEMFGRKPFTWQLNGNVNFTLFELVDIPLSINVNNFGSQYSYPSLPNRISIHPSYKWIRLHIGDVSMSFSPYTLNGHLFTGGGVELTPGKWNIAAMGGQMVRKVEYNPQMPSLPPSYGRWGTGAKVRYNGNKFFAGTSFFVSQDSYKETSFQADSMGIFPKSNVVVGIEGGVNITPNLMIAAEYGLSYLVRDTRPIINHETGRTEKREGMAHFYHAVKASLEYTFFKNTIGVGYERIDPEYQTLGAYYFNNDYENYTLNYARPLFKDKVNISLSAGVQRDDLEGEKQSKNIRFVGSANISYAPNENLNMALSGSTFQGYRVIKSQFDYINQTRPYENLDTLNFTQISQNIDFNLNWTMQSNDKHTQNISFFASYQEAADRQGKIILPGNLSRFLNASVIYGIDVTSIKTIFSLGFNASNSYSNLRNFLTLGPTFAANVRLVKGKFTTGVSVSYNRSYDQSVPMADVFNFRWNANARMGKRHSIQASAGLQHQKRMAPQTPVKKSRSFTGQLGYMLNF